MILLEQHIFEHKIFRGGPSIIVARNDIKEVEFLYVTEKSYKESTIYNIR